jgi:hypothetical protein
VDSGQCTYTPVNMTHTRTHARTRTRTQMTGAKRHECTRVDEHRLIDHSNELRTQSVYRGLPISNLLRVIRYTD